MNRHHISILAICLIAAFICFTICAFGLTTSYQNLSAIVGMCLFFIMTVGFFYATLHLSKVH